MANSVDLDQIASLGLILVYNVCPDLSIQKPRIITVLGDYANFHSINIFSIHILQLLWDWR